MAVGTNGIATWGDLRDLNGLNIPANFNESDTKCPRREQIQNFVDSNYTLTFKRKYDPFKLVRYEDIILTRNPSRINIANCYISTSGGNLLYFSATTVYQITHDCEIYNDNFSVSMDTLDFSLKDGYNIEIRYVENLGNANYWLGIPIEVGEDQDGANAMIFWFYVNVMNGVMSLKSNECYYDLRHYFGGSAVRIVTQRGGSSYATSMSFSLKRINNSNEIIESFITFYDERIIYSPFPHVVYGQNNQENRIVLRTYSGDLHLAEWTYSAIYNLLPSGYIYSWNTLISYHKNDYFKDLRLEAY